MNFELPYLGLGIVIALVAGIAVWFYSASSRSSQKRREEQQAKRMSHQPWDADSPDGRANR